MIRRLFPEHAIFRSSTDAPWPLEAHDAREAAKDDCPERRSMFVLVGLIGLLALLAIPAAIVYGIVTLVRRNGASAPSLTRGTAEPLPGTAERIFTYALSFAGLMAVLFGLSTLLALALIPVIPGASTLIGADDIRTRLSSSLAALIVGAPLWLSLWLYAQRRVERNPAERDAIERRLYLAAIFGTAAISALVSAYNAVSALISLAGNGDRGPLIRDAITGGSLALVFGLAWLGYARFGDRGKAGKRRETLSLAGDWPHDLATYAVTGVSLGFLLVGLGNALHQLLAQALGTTSLLDTYNSWPAWSGPIASVLTGGATWLALQVHDARRGGARILRVIYLYGAILVAAPLAVAEGTNGLYELIRRAFGYGGQPGSWDFLADLVPWLAVGAASWAYHWILIRRQARSQLDAGDTARGGAIPYPRRLWLVLLTAAGTVMAAGGAGSVLWIGVDAALGIHDGLSGDVWWRDGLSVSLALLGVGAALWLPAWSILQRAANYSSAERDARARRWLLFGLSLGGALVALGFVIGLLYQVLRAALGQTDGHIMSDALHDSSTALMALAVAGYYGNILRSAMRRHVTKPPTPQVRLVVLLAPGSEAALAALTRAAAYRVEVLGYIARDESAPGDDLETLAAAIARLGRAGNADQALLVLGPTGGHLYPYTGHILGPQAADSGTSPISSGKIEPPMPLTSVSHVATDA
jgi:hypothetical protein